MPPRHPAPQGGDYDEIGPPAFLAIRHLGPQDFGKAALGHARPAHHPLLLQTQRRRDDEDKIAAYDTAAFEQQRDVEHDERLAARPGARDEPPLSPLHHRMQDALKLPQGGGISEHKPAQPTTIDPARRIAYPRKRRLDPVNRRAARTDQAVNLRIGIKEGYPEAPQRRRGGALAHSDRAGEPEDDHRAATSVLRTAARNSRVTRTGVPNQASNPGRP